jgi:hypothetical protein
MTLIQKVLDLSQLWAAAKGHSTTARLATLVANDGKALLRLEAGRNATLATLDKFRVFLADPQNWPDCVIPAAATALLDDIGHIATAPASGERA